MGKSRKLTPEELAVRREREREFRELLERRRELDRRLATQHERRQAT